MIDASASDYSGKLALDANSLNSLKVAAKTVLQKRQAGGNPV